MMQFQKQTSLKSLSINEMWNLYRIIGKSKKRHYLVDEVLDVMSSLSPDQFLNSLHILYDNVPKENPSELAHLFIDGLKNSDFFSFQELMEYLNGRSKQ